MCYFTLIYFGWTVNMFNGSKWVSSLATLIHNIMTVVNKDFTLV